MKRSTDRQADAPQGRSSIRNDPAVTAAITHLEALFGPWQATPTFKESRRLAEVFVQVLELLLRSPHATADDPASWCSVWGAIVTHAPHGLRLYVQSLYALSHRGLDE